MRYVDRGWDHIGDKFVCDACFGDAAIKGFVRENAASKRCDYCGRTSESDAIAAPIDDVMGLIVDGIEQEWADPNDEGVGWESAEGGWQWEVFDSWELIREKIPDELEVENESLLEDICGALSDRQWCERDHLELRPEDAMKLSWERFCNAVKYETRYMFFDEPEEAGLTWHTDGVRPSETLSQIGEVVDRAGLIKAAEKDSRFWRARVHKRGVICDGEATLGPPPHELAVFSSRMSPAGIPVFYGASDRETAIAETYEPGRGTDVTITCAAFVTTRELNLLDLTSLPPFPSLFDVGRRHLRPAVLFLRDFVGDLSRKIDKDGKEHIEYVPTQIATEFLRHRFATESGRRCHGILYPSSRHEGGVCCVLFCQNENCREPPADARHRAERWLYLDMGSIVHIDPSEVR